MELTNLVDMLDPAEVQEIGRMVLEDYQEDEASRQGHLQKHADWLKLYYQEDDTERTVYEWSSNQSVPLMTDACNQFQSRAYKAFFPTRNFVAAEPLNSISEEDRKVAERVGKHLSYQLTYKNRNYRPDKNAMFLAVALHGSDFSKTYYDPLKQRTVVERVRMIDLVVPYSAGPCRMEDLPRKTHVISMLVNDSRKLANIGYFNSAIEEYHHRNDATQEIQSVEDEAQGVSESIARHNSYGLVLEQYRYMDLDNDGIEEPYIVWYDMGSQEVKRIAVNYEVDPNTGEAIADDDGLYKQPKEPFTHYQFLPNPNGFYGLGYGHLIGALNKAANSMLRQLIDAGTLANAGNMSGFVSNNSAIPGGQVSAEIGRFKKLPRGADDINRSIFQFRFPGPNNALNDLLQQIIGFAQRTSSTTDAVTGDIDKVMQPLTIMTLLENSLQLPTSVMEQMALAFEDELQKFYDINKKHFSGQDIFVDDNEQIIITPQDYAGQFRVIPILDPRNITRQQKVAKAQEVYQLVMNNPDLQQIPQARQEAVRRVMDALEVENVDAFFPEPPQIENIDNQDIENMYFLLPEGKRPQFDVFPDQDHVAHILSLHEFIRWLTANDPLEDVPVEVSLQPGVDETIKQVAGELKRGIITEVIFHLTQHIAYFYAQEKGAMQNGNGSDGDGQQQAAMGAGGGDAAAVEAAIRDLQSLGVLENLPVGSSGALPRPAGGAGFAGGIDSGMAGGGQPIDPGILGLADIMPDGQPPN